MIRLKLFRKEDGSVTLESALVVPIFVLFLVFLMYMVKLALVDIAINRATSETAKQIATQLYPAQVVVDEVAVIAGENEKYQDLKEGLEQNISMIEESVKETLGESNYNAIKEQAGSSASEMGQEIVGDLITPVVQMYLEDEGDMNIVDVENVDVTKATLPNIFNSGGNKYVEITTEYELDIPIPFIEKTYFITKHAKERAWIGS